MASLILSFGAILLSNYYQIIEYQLFDPHGSLFIYTNSESVVYCSEGNWTFLSSDQEINCIDIVNSLPHINNSHIILGIHRVQEYFLLPPAQNLCMSLYGDNLILHVGSQTLECFPYLTLGNIIQFDPFLLVNWKSIFSGYDFDVRGNWHLVCASLESSLLGHAYPESNYFSIISAIDFNINSIAFWLNLCHLDSKITTIYQRSILSSVSTCVVDQVKGPFISQKEEPLICIEDIFSQLPSEFPVVYISPMGIDFLEQMNTELSYQQHIADIYSIILATLNQDRGSTVLCITAGLRGLITSLTHQFSQHNLEEQFLTLFRSTDLNEWVNSFASFTFTMNNIFVLSDNKDDSQSKVDLFFRLADRNLFMNHFDEVFEKVSFSHNSANEIIVSNPLMKYLLGETLIRFLRYLSLASKFYSLDSFHLYLHHAGAHLMETPASITMCNASEILSYDISTFSVVSTTTHIVIFVSPSELEEARSILQEWRSSCQYCPLVIHYIIYVIPNSQDLDIMTSTNHEFRQILLTLQDYLFRLVVNSDIAVCLVGINSMRSFIHAGDDGLLPFPVIGGVSYVRLFSSLVFASKIYNINPSLSCLEANFNAFVGTSSQLVHFLSYVLNEANIGLSDNFLRWKTLQYLHTFKDSYNIKIDSHFKFFNFFVRYRSPTFEQDLSILVTRSLDYHSTISIAQEAIFSSPNILELYNHASNEFQLQDHLYGLSLLYFLVQLHPSLTMAGSSLLHQTPRNYKFVSHSIKIEDKYDLIKFIETVFLKLPPLVPSTSLAHSLNYALKRTLEIYYYDLGDIQTSLSLYQQDIRQFITYREVINLRNEWKIYREKFSINSPRCYYLTYANHMRQGLEDLLYSAQLSGIPLQVLGEGEIWIDFYQKFESYLKFLESPDILDTDIVVLFDGFDVLLFPEVKNIVQKLFQFSTPIVTCAEYGPHIDRPSAWFYKRGKLYNLLDTKFINSGCIVGRVKEMKIMLNNTIENMKLTHHDDQLALMEYYFHHPHIISIDRSNQIFLCAYKILSNDISFNYTTGKIMIRQQSTSIGLVHFNSGMVRDLSDKLIYDLRKYQDSVNTGTRTTSSPSTSRSQVV